MPKAIDVWLIDSNNEDNEFFLLQRGRITGSLMTGYQANKEVGCIAVPKPPFFLLSQTADTYCRNYCFRKIQSKVLRPGWLFLCEFSILSPFSYASCKKICASYALWSLNFALRFDEPTTTLENNYSLLRIICIQPLLINNTLPLTAWNDICFMASSKHVDMGEILDLAHTIFFHWTFQGSNIRILILPTGLSTNSEQWISGHRYNYI